MRFDGLPQRQIRVAGLREFLAHLEAALPNAELAHWPSAHMSELTVCIRRLRDSWASQTTSSCIAHPVTTVVFGLLNIRECNRNPVLLSLIIELEHVLIHLAVDGAKKVGITHDDLDVLVLSVHLLSIVLVDQ